MRGGYPSRLLPVTRQGLVALLFTLLALVFGGGGSPTAAAEIIVQLGFAGAFLAWVIWARGPTDVSRVTKPVLVMAAIPLVIALAQLVPLPPALWQGLPGRGFAERSLGVIGEANSWRPLSLLPSATLAAALAIIPASGLAVAVAMLGLRDRRAVLLGIGVAGIAGAILGAAQIAGGGDEFYFYELSHRGWATGFFANRNTAADFYLVASLALGAWAATDTMQEAMRSTGRVAMLSGQAVLLAAVIFTGSRAGIALLPIAGLAHAVMLAQGGLRTAVRPVVVSALVLIAAVVLVPMSASLFPRINSVAERFAFTGDFRTELWSDTGYAIARFWPAGSGLGTFVTAFLPVERLEVVDATYPNRAHNDYLEFVLETGFVAIPALVAVLVAFVMIVWRARRQQLVPRPFIVFSCASLAIVALHSVVDYPLRTMALASLCAVSAALCAPRFRTGAANETGSQE